METDTQIKDETQIKDDTQIKEHTEKTYTQAEVEALLQREADKRVSEALRKVEKKNKEKIKEAEKLAQMNSQEKYEYELKKREDAIIAKEKELALAENKNEASKILSEKGISLSLVDFVVAEDAETMKANIDLLDRAFKASVNAEIKKKIGSSGKPKTGVDTKTMTKDIFDKMSLLEQSKFLQENPEYKNTYLKGDF